jgi:hypothetical protein
MSTMTYMVLSFMGRDDGRIPKFLTEFGGNEIRNTWARIETLANPKTFLRKREKGSDPIFDEIGSDPFFFLEVGHLPARFRGGCPLVWRPFPALIGG